MGLWFLYYCYCHMSFCCYWYSVGIRVFLAYNIYINTMYWNTQNIFLTWDGATVFLNGAHPLNIPSCNFDSPRWFLSQINRQQLAPPLPPLSSRSCLRTGLVISHPLAFSFLLSLSFSQTVDLRLLRWQDSMTTKTKTTWARMVFTPRM